MALVTDRALAHHSEIAANPSAQVNLTSPIPAMSNVWQLSLKDSALISVTGLAELLRMSQIAAGSTRQYFTFFVAGGAIYLLLTAVSDVIFARAEKRANRGMQPSRLFGA